ncbi:CDP-diacylglycerol diphosphatase [Saccharopolyspora phatthalungensis]|uniref:CDP-diacylglycerol diphosphatase n=1 Tax=Saccharopolyspora phatthalungensis TaxID=664693 RepID=A0A840Q9F5_9PSEU|nr:CDP-diacylglycerol diphosphatase [Saccharopolyspora phatthalungensis]MBB5156567.1 CDP-diacylglycerol pyrophosphatase [Saccharopolyspora phatthalungensis]
MTENANADGLSWRNFIKLSGAFGSAAILISSCAVAAGQGTPAAQDLCGKDGDTSPELWRTAKDCRELHNAGKPTPESRVTTDTYVVLNGKKSANLKHNFLLVPTRRIKGIECDVVWTTGQLYWQDAWSEAQPGKAAPVTYPAGVIGLGVNPPHDANGHPIRTQDQLHIHMAGFRNAALGQLDHANVTSDLTKWANSIVALDGFDRHGAKVTRNYRALHVANLNQNLFALLRNNVSDAAKDMSIQTIIVASRKAGGFYVLNSSSNMTGGQPGVGGTSTCDDLLDYD